jgi:nucleoside-diphosphate-sugar epimerase
LYKKIIITGANGYIGKNLVKLLKKKKFKILVLRSNFLKKKKINKNYHAFVHLGFDLKKDCNIKKQIQILKNVINISKDKCKMLIFTSTAAVGNGKKRKILNTNNYQKAKYICEKILKKDKSNLKIIILRIFNIIGPNQNKGYFITDLIYKFINKKKVQICNYLNRRDFVYIDDVCEAIYSALINYQEKFQIFEIGSGRNFSLLNIAKKIKYILKSKKKIIKKGKKLAKPFNTRALIKNQKLKWIPKTNIKKALNLIIKNNEKKNWNNLSKIK